MTRDTDREGSAGGSRPQRGKQENPDANERRGQGGRSTGRALGPVRDASVEPAGKFGGETAGGGAGGEPDWWSDWQDSHGGEQAGTQIGGGSHPQEDVPSDEYIWTQEERCYDGSGRQQMGRFTWWRSDGAGRVTGPGRDQLAAGRMSEDRMIEEDVIEWDTPEPDSTQQPHDRERGFLRHLFAMIGTFIMIGGILVGAAFTLMFVVDLMVRIVAQTGDRLIYNGEIFNILPQVMTEIAIRLEAGLGTAVVFAAVVFTSLVYRFHKSAMEDPPVDNGWFKRILAASVGLCGIAAGFSASSSPESQPNGGGIGEQVLHYMVASLADVSGAALVAGQVGLLAMTAGAVGIFLTFWAASFRGWWLIVIVFCIFSAHLHNNFNW